MAREQEVFLTDAQWERIKPFLPKRKPSPRGGRPPCWRRLTEWEGEGVLVTIWQAFLDTLDERGLLDWDEVFVDASFSPAKKGATASEKPNAERVRSGWWWRMVREFHSHAGPKVLRLLRSRWSKASSLKSRSAKNPRR